MRTVGTVDPTDHWSRNLFYLAAALAVAQTNQPQKATAAREHAAQLQPQSSIAL
jgi:hypothetical protein